MSKLVVWKYVKATDIIDHYLDEDEELAFTEVVDSLPKAKEKAIAYLNGLIKEIENLKLRDLK